MWKLCTISQKTECLYKLLPVCPGAFRIPWGLPLIKTPGLVVTLQSTHQISIRVIFLTCSLDHVTLCPEPFHFPLPSEQKSNLLELESKLFQALTFVALLLPSPKYTTFSAKLEYCSFPNTSLLCSHSCFLTFKPGVFSYFHYFYGCCSQTCIISCTLWWCICLLAPRVLFLPFPCIPERLLTEGCAVYASIWVQPLESPGGRWEDWRKGEARAFLPHTLCLRQYLWWRLCLL